MQSFVYRVRGVAGLHARPVAQIAAEAMQWASAATVRADGRSADARNLVALMGLDARQGCELAVEVDGPDEEDAAKALRALFDF